MFAGFPGLWSQGVPVAVADLGFETDDQAYAAVDELGLPLTQTTVAEAESILDMKAEDAIVAIGDVTEAAELDELEQGETDGKGRKTVLQAVADRRALLAGDGDEHQEDDGA